MDLIGRGGGLLFAARLHREADSLALQGIQCWAMQGVERFLLLTCLLQLRLVTVTAPLCSSVGREGWVVHFVP